MFTIIYGDTSNYLKLSNKNSQYKFNDIFLYKIRHQLKTSNIRKIPCPQFNLAIQRLTDCLARLHTCTNQSLRLRQIGCHFANDMFKCIFFNENVWISIKISLKFVLKGPINNIPALVQIMAWRRPGHKPLSEPLMVSLLTHICVTRPQWVNLCHTVHPKNYAQGSHFVMV